MYTGTKNANLDHVLVLTQDRKYRVWHTYDKERFYNDITCHTNSWMTFINKTCVIRYHNSNIKCGYEDEPVPEGFKDTIM